MVISGVSRGMDWMIAFKFSSDEIKLFLSVWYSYTITHARGVWVACVAVEIMALTPVNHSHKLTHHPLTHN